MKKVQLDRFDMVLSVESYLIQNKVLYSDNKPLELAVKLLSSKIADLKEQLAIQLTKNTGIAVDKKNSRKALENQAFLLSSACSAYASVANDSEFYGRCHYTRSHFVHFRDMELVGICINLLREINTKTKELLAYNITEVKRSAFGSAIDHFINLIDEPKTAIEKRAEATAKIELLLKEIMEIIRLRLDNIISSMDENRSEFVSVYKKVRVIKNTGVRKRSLTVVVEDADTNKPIAGAVSEIEKGIRRRSGRRGMNFIQQLEKGRHQLRISHAEYEPQILKYSVEPGETTRLRVLMKRRADG